MGRAIPLPPFCAFMACYWVAVTLTFIVLAFVSVYISIARTPEHALMPFDGYHQETEIIQTVRNVDDASCIVLLRKIIKYFSIKRHTV